jgi:hypothetical protein
MTLLGIILALVPPALWVAWTETILLGVTVTGLVSAAALVLLAESEARDFADAQAGEDAARRRALADQSIIEIHRIFPLTYHHALVEKSRFRQTMERVRQLLK